MLYLTFWYSILHYWVSTRRIVYQIGDFRQFGNLAPLAGARSPNWRFLAQKSPKKKYSSKCLKLSNSSRNGIKNFCLTGPRAPADARARVGRENLRKVQNIRKILPRLSLRSNIPIYACFLSCYLIGTYLIMHNSDSSGTQNLGFGLVKCNY